MSKAKRKAKKPAPSLAARREQEKAAKKKAFNEAVREARAKLPQESGTPGLPPCFYELKRGKFFIPANGDGWIPVNDSRAAVHFKSAGFSEFVKDALGVSVLERALQRVVVERNVVYAGPVAGHWPGAAVLGGKRVLVTSAPRVPAPKRGAWPQLNAKFQEWLTADAEHGLRQWNSFHGWMLAAYRALVDKTFQPGLALMCCGLADSGKSVLQSIIVELLGGRTANPYTWLIGKTEFNGELLCAEVLTLDDEASERELKFRQAFGQRVKQLLVGGTLRVRGMFAEAFEARPYSRLVGCLNSTPQDLMMLPPMDEGVREKFLLLKISPGVFPAEPAEFQALRAAVSRELPAYLHWLTMEFELPEELRSKRFGVAHWQHPDLMFDLEELHPWRRLLELVDYVEPWQPECGGDGAKWEGGVQDLHELLFDKEAGRAGAVLRGLQSTGMDLKAAQQRLPHRLGDRKANGHKIWIIRKPEVGR